MQLGGMKFSKVLLEDTFVREALRIVTAVVLCTVSERAEKTVIAYEPKAVP